MRLFIMRNTECGLRSAEQTSAIRNLFPSRFRTNPESAYEIRGSYPDLMG